MLFLHKILALLFLAALAVAVPTAPVDPKTPPKALPGQPYGRCDIKDKFVVFDHYSLRGVNWNVTEYQLKEQLKSGGAAVTAWKWSYDTVNGTHTFKAEVDSLCSFCRAD